MIVIKIEIIVVKYNFFKCLYDKISLEINDKAKKPASNISINEYGALNSVLAKIPPNVRINANGVSYEILLKIDN